MNAPVIPVWMVALVLMEKTTTRVRAPHRILENNAKV